MPELKKGIYRHYKGKFYEVIGVARHSESLDEMVVYKALYLPDGSNLWVRPKKMFEETVVFNGKNILRFEFVKK